MNTVLESFGTWWSNASYIELGAVVTGAASVWLYGRENIWAWPAGIVSVVGYLYVFYTAQLYSDVVLQGVFLLLSVAGWYQWLRGGPHKQELKITPQMPVRERVALLAGAQGIAIAAAWYFSTYTDAALPFWDAIILGYSLLAQWLLNRKVLGNWLFWIAIDVLAICVYWQRELYPTAVLYFVFLCLAAKGYWEWGKKVKEENSRSMEVPDIRRDLENAQIAATEASSFSKS